MIGPCASRLKTVAAAAMFLIAIGALIVTLIYDYPRGYFVSVAAAAVGVLAHWQRRRPPG